MNKNLVYLYDPYSFEIDTKILSIIENNDGFLVKTDKTIFYPGGGGQPPDIGEIDGIRVEGVKFIDGEPFYVLSKKPERNRVKMKIDKARRLNNMALHSGQHLLSAVIYEIFKAETLSFSISEEGYGSIEIDKKDITFEEIRKVEEIVFKKIIENLEIKSYELSENDALKLPLRKKPKVKGKIRIVEIEKYDYSPCGGTHLRRTGEIGLLKIVKTDRVRKNIRLYFVCGSNAFSYISSLWETTQELKKTLKVSEKEIVKKANDLLKKEEETRKKLKRYIKKELEDKAEKIVDNFYYEDMKEYDIGEIKYFSSLLDKNGVPHILYNSYNGYFIIKTGKSKVNLSEKREQILNILSAKGGGRNDFIEGRGNFKENFDEKVSELKLSLGLANE